MRRPVVSLSWLISPAHSRCVSYGSFTFLAILSCASAMVEARSRPRTENFTGA